MRKHIKLLIFAVSSIITYFLFHIARASAIAERGNSAAIGGECLLLLIPIIAVLFYENIVLTKKVAAKTKAKRKSNIGKIRIVGIKSITTE